MKCHATAHRGPIVSLREFKSIWSDQSLTTDEIAQRLGITRQAVSFRAKARGLPKRKGGTPPAIEGPDFVAMWVFGVQTRDIVDHFQCCHLTPRNTARRLGLPARGRGWHSKIRIADYMEHRLTQQMAASAAETRGAMRDAEMVDGILGRARKFESPPE